MKTVDGSRGTAIPYLKTMNNEVIQKYVQRFGKMTEQRKAIVNSQNEFKLYSKVLLKYTILRVRSKISFKAFESKQVVLELIVNKVFNTLNALIDIGTYVMNEDRLKLENNMVTAISYANISLLKVMSAVFAERFL